MSLAPISTAGLKKALEVTIELTQKCELECIHCITKSSPNINVFIPRERVLSLFRELQRQGVFMLLLDGGDPVSHPDFIEILREAVSAFVVHLYTPGVFIDEAKADLIADIGPAHIFVKFPGPTEQTYEERTRNRVGFPQACRAVRHFVEREQSLSVVAIGTRQALGELHAYVALCHQLGVRKLNYVKFYAIGRGSENRALLEPTPADIDAFLLRALEVKDLEVIHPFFPRLHNCCRVFSTILADESVIPCTYLREHVAPFGNLRDTPFKQIWSSASYYAHRNISPSEPCSRCKLWDICQGGCRASAVISTGRIKEADPDCPLVRGWAAGSRGNELLKE